MPKTKVRDLVIVLPGITGSVLQKDGQDVWALSARALWEMGTSLGGALDSLRIRHDDPAAIDLKDGIRATRLIDDQVIIPGLKKIDGYTGIRRLFSQVFEVRRGSLDPAARTPANYFEFAYDWRRHNAVSACKLKLFIDERLPIWRTYSGAANAKVVLLAHSMGGLVARHYLEVLGGWPNCKALISFGTPYRGSVDALNYLCNGYKMLFFELTEVMRSFSSVYELLPIYPVIEAGGIYHRVAEMVGLPRQLDSLRARQALKFHRRIEAAVRRNRRDSAYFKDGYKIIPIVGVRQPTLQSASLEDGRVVVSRQPPAGVPIELGGGDSTVPRVSAVPIELDQEYRDTFVAEKHAALQNNDHVLLQIAEAVKTMQGVGPALRGGDPAPALAAAPALSLDVDDWYAAGEPVVVRASLVNGDLDRWGPLSAQVTPLADPRAPRSVPLVATEAAAAAVDLGDLQPGTYRVSVAPAQRGPGVPEPVTDVFAVARHIE